MKDKKLSDRLARNVYAFAIAGAISMLLWLACLLGLPSDWLHNLSRQLSWAFTLLAMLSTYHLYVCVNEEKEISARQTAEWTSMNNAANAKAKKIISEAKNTSLPLKGISLRDLNKAYDDTTYALETLLKIQMLPSWKKHLSRDEKYGIIKISGDLTCFGDEIRSVYLYDNLRIAPSSNDVELVSVSDEVIDKLINDAVAKIAEECAVIKRSIEAKARLMPSNALDVDSNQPLEVTRVVLFAPIPEPAETDSFTATL